MLFSESIDISCLFINNEQFKKDYGKYLVAFHHEKINPVKWFNEFCSLLEDSIGKNYLPIYRMADGEYNFLFGLGLNLRNQKKSRALGSYLKHYLFWRFGYGFQTSWGEYYSRRETIILRKKFAVDVAFLFNHGILCPFIYRTGNGQYQNRNSRIIRYLNKNFSLRVENRIFPFHFPLLALTSNRWKKFLVGRKVLVVTGLNNEKENTIRDTMSMLGVLEVGFLRISTNKAMLDRVNLEESQSLSKFELALVGAGIGSLNILTQMTWFRGPVIDVGGFMNCLVDRDFMYHGGAVKLPLEIQPDKFV